MQKLLDQFHSLQISKLASMQEQIDSNKAIQIIQPISRLQLLQLPAKLSTNCNDYLLELEQLVKPPTRRHGRNQSIIGQLAASTLEIQ